MNLLWTISAFRYVEICSFKIHIYADSGEVPLIKMTAEMLMMSPVSGHNIFGSSVT